jgi:hypothetical protein
VLSIDMTVTVPTSRFTATRSESSVASAIADPRVDPGAVAVQLGPPPVLVDEVVDEVVELVVDDVVELVVDVVEVVLDVVPPPPPVPVVVSPPLPHPPADAAPAAPRARARARASGAPRRRVPIPSDLMHSLLRQKEAEAAGEAPPKKLAPPIGSSPKISRARKRGT